MKYVEPSAFADPLSMWWPENDEGMRVGNRVAVICIMPMGLGSMKQQHVGTSAASRCKPAIGVRVDDWWCGWRRPSFDHRDHLDLFLTVPRPSTGSSQARLHRPERTALGKRKLARDRNARFEMKEAPTGADCFSKCEFFFCAESAVLWPIVAPS